MKICDILVTGGGMAGISAAARLSADAHVIVLEGEDTIGTHATGRSAAMFIKNYGNETLRKLNAASEGYLTENGLLSPRGELLVATQSEVPALNDYLDGATGMERLTAAQAVEMVPILRADKIALAAYEPTVQNIDVDRMLQGFVRELRRNNGQIVTKAKVIRMTAGWRVTLQNGDEYCAPNVVNAAGAWGDEIAGLAGVSQVGLTALRRSIAILPAPEIEGAAHWPVFASAAENWYAIPESGRLLVSPADEDPVAPHDVWADDMVLAEGLDRFEQATTLSVTHLKGSWAGLRSFVADRTPVVGYDSAASGFFWLVGQGGYGIQTAAALSQLTADLVLGKAPDIDDAALANLSPNRLSLTAG